MIYVIRSKDGLYFNDIELTQLIWGETITNDTMRYRNPLCAKMQIDRNLENCEIHMRDYHYEDGQPVYEDKGLYEPPKKCVYEVFIDDRWGDEYQETYLFSTLKKAQDKMDELYHEYCGDFENYNDVEIERDDTYISVNSDYDGHIDVYLNMKEVL